MTTVCLRPALASLGIGVWLAARAVPAALIFEIDFDGAAGSNNGDVVSGVTGGTATIRDGGAGTSQVLTSPDVFGDGGYLVTLYPAGAVPPYGARVTPASAASSFAAMFSTDGGSGQRQLEGAMDFFFRSDSNIDAGEELRFLDNDNRGNSGLRMVWQGWTSGYGDMRFEVIGNTDALGTGVSSLSAYAGTGFQIQGSLLYHLGMTVTTDDATGQSTLKLFGVEGTGAINTSASTLEQGFIGSLSFNINESVVLNGFTAGAYDLGNLRNSGQTNQQEYDKFRIYDSVPAQFDAIPEPSTALLTALGWVALARSVFRRRA